MPAVVMKFGGSSVVDAAAIDRVVAIVERERARGNTPVVVVSALGGVTDTLLSLAKSARGGAAAEVRDGVAALLARHRAQAVALGADRDPSLAAAIDTLVQDLQRVLDAIQQQPGSEPAALDAVAATGELLSSRLVAAAMTGRGLPAVWIDARDAVRTDDRYTCAAPLVEQTNAAVEAAIGPVVAAGRIAVLGGFIGRAPDGSTTTLGRGGSDYSASLVGAPLHAAEIQIWTDVDGMLTADPRIVYDAEVVPHLSFAEASELAYFGAKVLHPSTIFPAVSRNIPVRILNSRRPEARGTLITADPPVNSRPFAALACKRGITVIDITSTRMLMAHGFLLRVFAAFEAAETAVDVVTTSEVSVSVTIDDNRRGPEIVASLLEFAEVTVEEQMAILTVVGDRLATNSTLAARIIGAMTGFPLRMISQAASRKNVTIVLPEASLAPAMMHLHRELFRSPALAEAAAGQEPAR
ncbi:MAG TPA: lysine-sensitive aspartokinase 3 [Vicinamibacterales bacterium]|nr:lysine-sensitive aspartokinase 3 [Vicinamibacterales bacterium]